MSLRTWGGGRVVLACLAYWVLLLVGFLSWMWADVRRVTAEYGNEDFLRTHSVGGPVGLLLVLAPPALLTIAWLRARRRP